MTTNALLVDSLALLDLRRAIAGFVGGGEVTPDSKERDGLRRTRLTIEMDTISQTGIRGATELPYALYANLFGWSAKNEVVPAKSLRGVARRL